MSLANVTLGRVAAIVALAACAACARPRVAVAPLAVDDAPAVSASVSAPGLCDGCSAPTTDDVIRAVAQRVADLRSRGGACRAYGAVLEESLAAKRIVVRPFMWRVGTNLASAQALSTGEIDVAREVDALNIGVRSLEDVVHSVEHEAAHIAFAIPSGKEWTESLVDARVAACRVPAARAGATP